MKFESAVNGRSSNVVKFKLRRITTINLQNSSSAMTNRSYITSYQAMKYLILLSPRRKVGAVRDGNVLLFVWHQGIRVRHWQCWWPRAATALLGQSGQCPTCWWQRGHIESAIGTVL